MRWKLLIVLSFAWLLVGVVGLHVAELSDTSPFSPIVIGPASLAYSVSHHIDHVFVDAAHGPPFLTIPGIVLVYLLPGVLLIWFAVYHAHLRASPLVAALPLVLIAAGLVPWVYEPSGPAAASVRHGDYLIEPPRSCRPGAPPSTRRVFFKERMLTRVAGEIAFSPINPSRILYEAEPWCTDDAVATFYFDGARTTPAKVFGGLQASALSWSPDDRFLVSSKDGLVVVDLQTGESSDLSDVFVGNGVSDSHVEFRGWSPDGKALAVENVSSFRREDGSDFTTTDLVSFDPATLQDRYVATMRGRAGWNDGAFAWVAKDGAFELSADASHEPDAAIYRRSERQRTTDLGGDVALVETVRGFPGESNEVVIHQAVGRKGVVVWESRYTTYAMAASPDHRYLVMWNNVNRLAQWRVVDLFTGKSVAVQDDDGPARTAPKFGRWSDDSRSIIIAVDAYERETDASGREKPDARLVPYRQTFLVDASNGVLRKQNHCQQAGVDKPTWDNTPCAGTFRD